MRDKIRKPDTIEAEMLVAAGARLFLLLSGMPVVHVCPGITQKVIDRGNQHGRHGTGLIVHGNTTVGDERREV